MSRPRGLTDVIADLPAGRISHDDAEAVVAAVEQQSPTELRELLAGVEAAIAARREQTDTVDAILRGLVVAGAILRRIVA